MKGISYSVSVVHRQKAHTLLKYISKALLNSGCDFLLIDFFCFFPRLNIYETQPYNRTEKACKCCYI